MSSERAIDAAGSVRVDSPTSSRVAIEADSVSKEYLIYSKPQDWLRELLFRFDSRHLLFSRFDVRVEEDGLEARIRGEPLDPARHSLDHEVKAITYHGLRVEQEPGGGWLAEVIVDI